MDQFFSDNLVHFYWALAAFAVFVLLFIKLGVKHVLTAVDARDAKIAGELAESEAAFTKAKQIQLDLEKQMREAEGRISAMMVEARRDAEVLKSKTIEAGRSELDAMRNRALGEIEAARHTAVVHLRAEVAEIATLVAEKILRGQLDSNKHEDLVMQAIESYEAKTPVKA